LAAIIWLTADAPRPTLLVYKLKTMPASGPPSLSRRLRRHRPFFAVYGKQRRFEWHENSDPELHNYQLDNRLAAYSFSAATRNSAHQRRSRDFLGIQELRRAGGRAAARQPDDRWFGTEASRQVKRDALSF